MITRLAVTAALLLPATSALAQTDRIIDTETPWGLIYGASSAQITSSMNSGSRPFSIERVAANQYDTIFVSNSGPYSVTGTLAIYNTTGAGLSTWLSNNNLRLLDLEVYDGGGGTTQITAIGVPNSGPTATPGWGYVANVSFSQITTWLNDNPSLRLIDLDAYRINGNLTYSAVAVPNSGANFQSGWWYGGGMTAAQVSSSLTANSARLVSIEIESPGTIVNPQPTFACLMVAQNPGGGWWHHALDSAGVAALLDSTSSRLTCLKRYTTPLGATRWAAATVDNANAQTRRMRQYIWDANSGGSTGFMLKQVGGPVLASNNINFVWEPCSSVKLLHGIYALNKCFLNQDALGNTVTYRNYSPTPSSCDDCPFDWSCPNQFFTLSHSLHEMLEPSSNIALIALEHRYNNSGNTTINQWADANGFGGIQVDRQNCDCGVVLNTATCNDFSVMLEKAHDGTLLNSTWENELHIHMNDLAQHGWSGYFVLYSIINDEADDTDLTAAELEAFRDNVKFANKGGSYDCGTGLYWRTEAGWASLPFKSFAPPFGYLIIPREYVFSLFAHNATNESGAAIVHNGKEAILREQIREALASWDAACNTPSINNHPDPITRNPGQTATFTIGVIPNPATMSYQWLKGGTAITNGATGSGSTISGATSATLTISNVSSADANSYACRVTTSCGFTTSSSAALSITCYANCDGSQLQPVLTANDFTCFINAYATNQPYANCDGSAGNPLLTGNDFICYINAYSAGCP